MTSSADDKRYAIGVDLGGQSIKLGLVDSTGAIEYHRQVPVDSDTSVDAMVELFCEQIDRVREDARGSGREPGVVGVVMPGYMNRERTELTFVANLPNLSSVGFLKRLRERIDLPMVFDADSNAAAFGEYKLGRGGDAQRLIVAAVGTGIGGGVVIDGEIVRLFHHIAGSLGHVLVDPNGPRCRCGARGCVEALAAGPAIESHANQLADEHSDSLLAQLRTERGRLTGVEINEALQADDDAARRVVTQAGYWLGAGIANWSVIFAPEKVLIGGGMAALGMPYLQAIRETVAAVGQPNVTRDLTIDFAALGPHAGLIGAATLAMTEQ